MNKLEIQAACMEWLREGYREAPLSDKTYFRVCEEEDLIQFHMTLGMDMRNDNKLWAHRDVIGCPDEFSMSIIHSFWEELRGL